MPVNKDPEKAAKVVRVQSYKDGAEKEKGVVVPENVLGDESAEMNKKWLNDQVKQVVNLILVDREGAVQQIMREHDSKIRENAREVLADPPALVAPALADLWVEKGIELPNVQLYEGMCGYEHHTWFRAGMDARAVGEPDYFYIIDPWGRGVSVISLNPPWESDIVVLRPWSPFHVVYAGKPVRSLAKGENDG